MEKPTNHFQRLYRHMNRSSTSFNSIAISFVSSSLLFSPSVLRYIFQTARLNQYSHLPQSTSSQEVKKKLTFHRLTPQLAAPNGSPVDITGAQQDAFSVCSTILPCPQILTTNPMSISELVLTRTMDLLPFYSVCHFLNCYHTPNLTINSFRTTLSTGSRNPSSILFFGAKMDPSSNPAPYYRK